jgi:hypothetical protein
MYLVISNDKFQIPEESISAIMRGCQRKDAVVEMELMGLSQRIINALEESEFEIIYLEELIGFTLDEIMTINNIGATAINQLCSILVKYSQLEKLILHEQKSLAG